MTTLFRVEDFSLRYRDQARPILSGISWMQNAGEVVLLQGRNGSGKSSLLRCLAGDPRLKHEGRVDLNGRTARFKPRWWRAAGVRWVPQLAGSFEALSVLENLSLSARGETASSLDPVFELFPSLEPLLRRQVRHLSGGERRMVDLAPLALVRQPVLLWLDEPVASLSANNTLRFIRFLEMLIGEGTSVLITTHKTIHLRAPVTVVPL